MGWIDGMDPMVLMAMGASGLMILFIIIMKWILDV